MDEYKLQSTEYFCSATFSKPSYISAASLKAVQEGNFEHLIPAFEVKWNLKRTLIYLQENRSRLKESLPLLSSEQVLELMIQILDIVLSLKQSLLLNPKGLVFDSKYVWIQSATLQCEMIFLPLALPLLSKQNLEDQIKEAFDQYLHQASSPLIAKFETFTKAKNLYEMRKALVDLKRGNVSPAYQDSASGFVLENIEDSSRIYPSALQITLLGRSAQADLQIEDSRKIGRKHARIERKFGGRSFFIEDLASANGTFLNGIRLQPHKPVEVREQDIIQLADQSYRFRKKEQ